LKLHRLAAANDRLRVAKPHACDVRAREYRHEHRSRPHDANGDRRNRPNSPHRSPAAEATVYGFAIDHPDPELGEQLMAKALGVADREAMDGILRQLVRASVSGGSPDEVNLSFMIAMVKSIKPPSAPLPRSPPKRPNIFRGEVQSED
jgi:hypothetical protein